MFSDLSYSLRRKGILVDTNLFLLWLIGNYDLSKLRVFRPTQKYNEYFHGLLIELLSNFSRMITTTNVITEVDNLSRQTSKNEWPAISAQLRKALSGIEEETFASIELANHRLHPAIGITDCSIFEISAQGILVVTDDLPLTIALERAQRPVINLSRYLRY